jgi:hypothetical protein
VPITCDTNLLCAVDHLDQDALEQMSDNGLALLLGRGLGALECGQILLEFADRDEFG